MQSAHTDAAPRPPAGADAPARIIHIHIPKTAGNALKTAMLNCTTRPIRVFMEWQEENFHSFDPADYDFFSGHIGFNTASRIGGDIVSVFRNPLDRFVSVYYYWRYLHNAGIEVRQATIMASKYSLDDFVRIRDVFPLIEELFNRMTFQCAHGTAAHHRDQLRSQGLTDEDIYRLAAGNIETFAVIGVQEDIPGFELAIRRRFGLDIALGEVNRTADRRMVDDLSFATRSKILDWVYMDMELYDHVRRLCRDHAEAAQDTPVG